MATFDFSSARLLFFHAQGQTLGAGIRFGDPQVDILAGGPFGGDFGVPENIFLMKLLRGEDSGEPA